MDYEIPRARQQVANVENEYARFQGRVKGHVTVVDSPNSQPEPTYINHQSINERTPAPESAYEIPQSHQTSTPTPESVYEIPQSHQTSTPTPESVYEIPLSHQTFGINEITPAPESVY